MEPARGGIGAKRGVLDASCPFPMRCMLIGQHAAAAYGTGQTAAAVVRLGGHTTAGWIHTACAGCCALLECCAVGFGSGALPVDSRAPAILEAGVGERAVFILAGLAISVDGRARSEGEARVRERAVAILGRPTLAVSRNSAVP